MPPWLRAIPYTLPQNPALKGQQARVFEVTDTQRPEDVLVHNAAYLMEMGRYAEAEAMEPALRGLDSYLPALAVLARIQGQASDASGVQATVARIGALGTPQAGLAAEDQVRVAVALAIGGDFDMARSALQRCLAQIDEKSLRRLTSGTLSDLLSLCDHLGVAFPDPALRARANGLLPPSLR
jgi:hypothetical protein